MNKMIRALFLWIAGCYFISAYAIDTQKLKQSYFKLTTSNGLIVSVYNEKENRIDYVYPHIFARLDSAHQVRPFVGNITLKGSEKPASVAYVQNTHVIEAKYKNFAVFYTASFVRQDKVFYIVVRGDRKQLEQVNMVAETTPESVVTGIDHLENPYEELPCRIAGNALTDTYTKPYQGDVYEKYFLYSFTDSLHTDSTTVTKAIQYLKDSKTSLIDEEVSYMRNLMAHCHIPPTLTEKERNVVEQGISVLKMSQVSDKEIFPNSHGQIMGSLRPGLWHMAWVRDGSYTIEAMTRLGMYDEARKGLEFMLKAPANKLKYYKHTDGIDYGPGMDYQISLVTYYGNGEEEASITDKGPNIEYDNFGIFLTAFMNYVNKTGDWAFYTKWNPVVTSRIGDVIIHCMDSKNWLIKADSGPWEHWLAMPKQYTFTSGVCARGLELLAAAQKSQNMPYENYAAAAARIKQAIFEHMLVDGQYFKGNANDEDASGYEYWDGGTFEIFSNGLVDNRKLFASHIKAYSEALRIPGSRLGYVRLPSKDPYENQEWVFINLRIAYGHILLGDKNMAHQLINHITEQASLNHHLIPEMFSNRIQMSKVDPKHYKDEVWCNCIRDEDNLYIATIPMVGYGSGAYAIAILAYHGY